MARNKSTVEVNDFVWAKLARYPPWPAIVMEPDPLAPPKHKNSHWIYFFGSHDYAWVDDKNIKSFEEYKDEYKGTYKQLAIREAIEEIEDIIENVENDPNYEIEFVQYTPKERKRSSTRSQKFTESPVDSGKRPLEEYKYPSRRTSRYSRSDDNDRDASNNDVIDGPIIISDRMFGFVAANIYDEGIIKNLIKFKHRTQVWSSSSAMCEELQDYADRQDDVCFKICTTRRELLNDCNIIFNHQTNPEHVEDVLRDFGLYDENDDFLKNKLYVEFSNVDPDTSTEHCKLLEDKGATYMEAMLQGSISEANLGELVIIAAGDEESFSACSSCFKAMGKAALLLENIGSASKAHMLLEGMRGVLLASFTEFLALADKWGVELGSFIQLFSLTTMSNPYLKRKADIIVENKFAETEEPIQEMQRNLFQVRKWTNKLRFPSPFASVAFEIFKHGRRLGYDNQDTACIYNRTRY